jgi:hypothetical protein
MKRRTILKITGGWLAGLAMVAQAFPANAQAERPTQIACNPTVEGYDVGTRALAARDARQPSSLFTSAGPLLLRQLGTSSSRMSPTLQGLRARAESGQPASTTSRWSIDLLGFERASLARDGRLHIRDVEGAVVAIIDPGATTRIRDLRPGVGDDDNGPAYVGLDGNTHELDYVVTFSHDVPSEEAVTDSLGAGQPLAGSATGLFDAKITGFAPPLCLPQAPTEITTDPAMRSGCSMGYNSPLRVASGHAAADLLVHSCSSDVVLKYTHQALLQTVLNRNGVPTLAVRKKRVSIGLGSKEMLRSIKRKCRNDNLRLWSHVATLVAFRTGGPPTSATGTDIQGKLINCGT